MDGWLWLGATFVLASVFAVAGLAKLADPAGTRRAIAGMGTPERLVGALALMLPVAELATAAMLIPAGTARSGALAAFALLLGFACAIAWNLSRGRAPDCHCFGQVHSATASRRTVARNLALAILAAGIWSSYEPAGLGSGETVLLAVAVVLVAVALVWRAAARAPAESRPVADPLAVGSPAPGFALPTLDGTTATLERLLERGRPVLLLFTDPHCGPCLALAPGVARWQQIHASELTIAVVERANGQPCGRDEHGRANVALETGEEVSAAYGAAGTPSAVLIDVDGAIASPPAAGADAIERLVAGVVGVEAIERDPVGEHFALPLDRPVVRREFVARLATASAAAGLVLGWPARAVADIGRGLAPCPKPWQRRCGGRCVSPLIDENNCGRTAATACGHRCEYGYVCAGGRCVGQLCTIECHRRPPGQMCCPSGSGPSRVERCVDPARDLKNCGGCGREATGLRPACCQGLPRDLYSDPLNCGTCFKRCPRDKPLCYAGQCRATCGPTLRSCGTNHCYNPQTETCRNGRPAPRPPRPPADDCVRTPLGCA